MYRLPCFDHTMSQKADPLAAQSKAWICGRSLAMTVGLNPAGSMNVCLL